MRKFDHYFIYFSSLKNGKHDFKFEIDKSLFLEYGNSEIIDANISVEAVLEKKSDHLAFQFDINGSIKTNCDRCLEEMEVEIHDQPKLYVSFGEITSDLTDIDDTMILAKSEDKLDLSKHFYDYILLNLPIKKIHPGKKGGKGGCNLEMLKKLQEYQTNENKKKDTDPRWDKLKSLLN